jgi:AcrR family transcriptional regulator
MGRWEPGAAERLQRAALELFADRGFEQTTAADIAQSVGLTERTFYRHFADKREVLFAGQDRFLAAIREAAASAPADAAPMAVALAAVSGSSPLFTDERRPFSRLRQRVIDANPALQERERHKMAGLAAAVAETLRDRGVTEPTATLAAESAATVFGVAFARWIADGEERSLPELTASVFQDLVALTTQPIWQTTQR